MTDFISKLREPKFHLMEGVDIAYFDTIGTITGGYIVAEKMNWNKPKTITGMFILGYLIHTFTGTETPLTSKINESFAIRPINGITTADLPINNSTDPVGVNEIRYSTK